MAQQFVQMVTEVTFRWESRHGAQGHAMPASRLLAPTLRTFMAGSAKTVEGASKCEFLEFCVVRMVLQTCIPKTNY